MKRLVLSLLLVSSAACAQGPTPAQGFLPDEKTAVAVAQAIMIPIYGKSQIESERPFHGDLKDNIWTVQGRLPAGWDGGTAVIRLNKTTGAVISYIHYK